MAQGEKFGTVDEAEEAFVRAARLNREQELVYVVVGTGARPEFYARLDALGIPHIDDGRILDGALIVAGTPDEWAATPA